MSDRRRNPHRADRAASALVAYVRDDMTLEQIGKRHGVCREMIRQDLNWHDPSLYRLAQRRRRARSNLQRFVNRRCALATFDCEVCGESFTSVQYGKPRRFCSPSHRHAFALLRWQADEDYRDSLRVYQARWNVKNDIDRVHAENVLAGTDQPYGWRAFNVGSLAFHWAVRAYVCEWPIFERLNPQVQQQIRAWCDPVEPQASAK